MPKLRECVLYWAKLCSNKNVCLQERLKVCIPLDGLNFYLCIQTKIFHCQFFLIYIWQTFSSPKTNFPCMFSQALSKLYWAKFSEIFMTWTKFLFHIQAKILCFQLFSTDSVNASFASQKVKIHRVKHSHTCPNIEWAFSILYWAKVCPNKNVLLLERPKIRITSHGLKAYLHVRFQSAISQ